MNTTIETATLYREIEKIQAMVICARVTVDSIADTDSQAAATLLMEADNRLFALKQSLEPKEAEAA
jgi:hypothetical protein